MDRHRRQELTRVAAPVAFLAVATIAILLVRSGLHRDRAEPAQVTTVTQRTPSKPNVVPVATTSTTQTAVTPTARTYTVESGDTLGTIAAQEGTTVDELLVANPGIDPTGLQIGDRIILP